MTEKKPQSLLRAVRLPVFAGFVILVAFFAGLGSWAYLAPLTSAALAPGEIGVETRRQMVQHLEGGIIEEIAVKEGDTVEEGALLVRMNKTVAESTFELLKGQYIDLLAEMARLRAEQKGEDRITFPDILDEAENQERVQLAKEVQTALFDSRAMAMKSKIDLLNRRNLELHEQVKGFEIQTKAAHKQLELINKEEGIVRKMVEQGLGTAPRLLALQRQQADLEGLLGEIASRISQANIRIGETNLEVLDLQARQTNQINSDLRNLVSRIEDMEPRIKAAQNTLHRVELRSPAAGTIVGLRYHTVGGVIPPGGHVLDIIPSNVAFQIEAQVSPADIDVVRPGLPAEIRFLAFSSRTTPTLMGTVVHVSADRLMDESKVPYYAIYVQINPEELTEDDKKKLVKNLYPGMPVEVMVVTGKRTAMDYFLQPITETFARAFREN